jgi:uncharacterized membrane protein
MSHENLNPPSIDTLDYASGSPKQTVTSQSAVWMIFMSLLLAFLTLLSLYIVLRNANDEPYYGGVRESDAWTQVGLSSALIALWIQWCIAIAILAMRRKVHWAFLIAYLWAGLAICFLVTTASGYLSDVIAGEKMSASPGAWQQSSTMPASSRSTTSPSKR